MGFSERGNSLVMVNDYAKIVAQLWGAMLAYEYNA